MALELMITAKGQVTLRRAILKHLHASDDRVFARHLGAAATLLCE